MNMLTTLWEKLTGGRESHVQYDEELSGVKKDQTQIDKELAYLRNKARLYNLDEGEGNRKR